MAIETTYLAEYIQGRDAAGASNAFGYSPNTRVQVLSSTQAEYRFGALAGPQFTAAEQQVAVYLSTSMAGGSVRIEVRRGTQVLASRTEKMTSSYVGATRGMPTPLTFREPGEGVAR